jgi:hypothetical protein
MPTYGARGTDALLPDRIPRGRKLRGPAQPYRQRQPRQLEPTLEAMLRGRSMFGPNPADWQREREKLFRRLVG